MPKCTISGNTVPSSLHNSRSSWSTRRAHGFIPGFTTIMPLTCKKHVQAFVKAFIQAYVLVHHTWSLPLLLRLQHFDLAEVASHTDTHPPLRKSWLRGLAERFIVVTIYSTYLPMLSPNVHTGYECSVRTCVKFSANILHPFTYWAR